MVRGAGYTRFMLQFFHRVSRAFDRFVNSFAATAVASHVETPGQRGVDPAAVVGVLGELEKRDSDEDSP